MLTASLKARPITSWKCPGFGHQFDTRDLGRMLEHVDDAEREIEEGPEPRREGQLQ